MSTVTDRLTAVIGRRIRAMAARFKRPSALKRMSRAEFEQVALDLDLSHPELYGLLTESGAKGRPSKPDVSPEQAQAMQAYLPIGPSCC